MSKPEYTSPVGEDISGEPRSGVDPSCPLCGEQFHPYSEGTVGKANNMMMHYWWHKLEQLRNQTEEQS